MARKLTQEQIIQRAVKKHGSTYDYSLLVYKGYAEAVKIICKTHGEFEMTAECHIFGQGCPKCGRLKSAQTRALTQEDFLSKAKDKHGDRYDYSESDYERSSKKIAIKCKKHGVFYQMPSLHLIGQNCPKCAVETRHGFSKERLIRHCESKKCDVKMYLLKVYDQHEVFLKIGITTSTIKHRFCSFYYEYIQIKEIAGSAGHIWELEKKVHELLKDYKYKPQKYFKGHTECYKKEHLQKIIKLWKTLES